MLTLPRSADAPAQCFANGFSYQLDSTYTTYGTVTVTKTGAMYTLDVTRDDDGEVDTVAFVRRTRSGQPCGIIEITAHFLPSGLRCYDHTHETGESNFSAIARELIESGVFNGVGGSFETMQAEEDHAMDEATGWTWEEIEEYADGLEDQPRIRERVRMALLGRVAA
jgi:hypothetical protein